METKAEYVTDTYVVDKLLMRDMVDSLKAATVTLYKASFEQGDIDYRLEMGCLSAELRATLTQIYDRWPELAN